jgi:acyl transferase domain-containing protein/acyl-CoA synthetase (AMP-forming)/AMP-acid ligase II/dienelactone hydrolase
MLGKFSTLVDLLRDRALYYKDRTAFIFLPDGETAAQNLTYGELEKRARAIAAQLQAQKACGERALLLYPPGLEFIEAFFGCLYAGTIAVPAYPPRRGAPLTRLESIVANAKAQYTLTTQSLIEGIQDRFAQNPLLKESMHWLTTDNIADDEAENWRAPNIHDQSIAFLQYTSGSTGMPKGAIVNHRNLLHNSALINLAFEDKADSIGVSWLPSYHDMGLIGGILQPIYVGAFMVVMPPVAFLQRPLRWLQAISNYRATSSGGPNFAYELCLSKATPEALENLDLSSWQLAFSGAEPVRAETLERFSKTFAPCGFRPRFFSPCYGMAETTLIVSSAPKQAEPILKTVDGRALAQNRIVETDRANMPTLVSCGQPLGDLNVAIANPESGEPCLAEEIGEIWVSGDSVVQGYWNRPELNEAVFGAYLTTGEGPFLRTGDLGFLQNGELYVTGRRKDLIIIRGRNHYPQDIEKTVESSHPALRIAWGAAFSVEIDGEERLAIAQEVERSALRKLKTEAEVEKVTQAIRQAVAQAHELQPYAILLLKTGSIPKTSSGKIQRFACREGLLNGTLDAIGEWRASQQSTVSSQQSAVSSQQSAVNSQQSAVSSQQSTTNNQQPTTNNQQPTTNNQQQITNNQQQITNNQQIQTWLIHRLAEYLNLSPQNISPHQPFAYYGLDSVAAVRLTGDLEEWLETRLSPTLAYDYPTIAALAAYLSGAEEATPQSHLNPVPVRTDDKIAIVGLGCRFPQAENPEAFWQLLSQGQVAIAANTRPTLTATPGGFLDRVDLFEPQFFNISPREASEMDPQQRLLLEVAWEALEDSAIAPETLSGSATGVFIGISSTDYLQLQSRSGLPGDAYAGTGNAHSIAANRLSYFLDLRGPSMAIDTACSSSLVAIHLACQSLQQGDCNAAIAGGVNVILAGELTDTFTKAGMLAADGRCKTFDANADGYGRGEGCGVVILKRLSDARQAGDRVLATIEGSALVQDGRSNGLTAPNGFAQQAAIRQALARAGIAPSEVSYIEAHGTGTPLGDPIEVNALKAVLLPGRNAEQKCWLGSVKTNIGHLEAAAGIAGLIKVVLAGNKGLIPPHQNLQELNPHIDLDDTPLAIPTTPQLWAMERRIAGVSSFGFGGMNAHVIVAAFQGVKPESEPEFKRPLHLLALSAKSENALNSLEQRYRQYLAANAEVDLADLCFTANTGRSHFEYRRAAIASSLSELGEQLSRDRNPLPVVTNNPLKIAFLCAGQGSQYANMGRELYETQPRFREAIDRCDEVLRKYIDKSLFNVLYSTPGSSDVHETAYTQPALFALEYAIAQLWQSWGIQPEIILGHSVGEYVAACLAGVFSLEDGLKLIAARAQLMQALPQAGGMVAVFASAENVTEILQNSDNPVTIAAYNAPHLTVISGTETAIQAALQQFKAKKIKAKALNVSHAFHSPLMQPMMADFERVARSITYHPPRLKLVSNLTGELASEEIATPEYWCRHILEPVRFAQSMAVLEAEGCNCFIEIGAKSTLLGMGRQCLSSEGLWLPSLHPNFSDTRQLLLSLQQLYENGATIDWIGFDRDYPRQKLALPTYPFQRQSYWLEALSRLPNAKLQTAEAYQVQWVESVISQQSSVINDQLPITSSSPSSLSAAVAVIFCAKDRLSFAKEIAQEWQQQGGRSLLVALAEAAQFSRTVDGYTLDPSDRQSFERLFNTIEAKIHSLVYLADRETPEDLTLPLLQHQQKQDQIGLLHLVQALNRQQIEAKLWLLTAGAQAVKPQDTPNLASATLWGMGRAIALELPHLWGGLLDLDAETDAKEAISSILNADGEDQIAWRDNKCYVARLRRYALAAPANRLEIAPDATYLITGGWGSLGLKTARWLLDRGATSLVLTGRNPSAAAAQIATLDAPEAKITAIAADVSSADDVAQLLDTISSLPPLRGIIHAAGTLEDGLLKRQTWPQFERVLAPKVAGAWNLHGLTQAYALDFFVTFSSVASVLGSPGQSNYAAANAFLDALAAYRVRLGLPGLSVNWGAWAEGGMAQGQESRLQALGFEPLSPARALSTLEGLIEQNVAQVAVLEADWQKVAATSPILPSLLKDLSDRPVSNSPATAQSSLFEQLEKASPDQKETLLQTYLQQQIARSLHVQPDQITPSQNLLEMGLDSLMVMEAINQLKNDLQLLLYPREFYERPRLEALAKYIAAEFERTHHPDAVVVAEMPTTTLIAKFGARSTAITPPSPKLDPAAFILSSPRAGSTLLRVMLAGHPQLFSPPELHLLPFATLAEREAELALSNLDEGLPRSLMELFDLDAEAAMSLSAEMSRSNLSIADVYAKLQNAAGTRLLVDKSPTYALDRATLDRAEAWFNHAKYIHLVRHPYAAIESFTRLRMEKLLGEGEVNPYRLAEQIWTICNQNIFDFSQTLDRDRYHLVYYENLVKQPEVEMQRICEFLGVEFVEAVLNPYEGDRMTDGTRSRSLSIGDPNFLNRRRLDPSLADTWKTIELPQPLGEMAQSVAEELGYQLPVISHQSTVISHQLPIINDQLPITNYQSLTSSSPSPSPSLDLPMREEYIEMREMRLCLCEWGDPDGEIVLLLHGILEQGAAWEQTAQPLAAQGYRVVAPDLRGHGYSAKSPHGAYRLLDFLGDLDGIVAHLNRQPMALVGHSLGSAIASLYASARPETVRSLVLVEPILPVESKSAPTDQLIAHLDALKSVPEHPVFPDLATVAARLQAGTPSMAEAIALKLAQRNTEACPGGVRWRWDARLRDRATLGLGGLPFGRDRYLQLLQHLQPPVTLIYGDRSTFNRPEDLHAQAQAMPKAKRIQLSGGHNLHIDAPAAIAAIINKQSSAISHQSSVTHNK